MTEQGSPDNARSDSMQRRFRVGVWITHPIQYHAPLFRKLAQHPQIDLTALYGSDFGVVDRKDPEFGVSFRWDTPLLEGYRYRFMRNYSFKRTPMGFWWVLNPGIVREMFRQRFDAIIIHGYASATSWLAYLAAWLAGIPVLFRGETLLREQPAWKRLIKGAGLRFLFRHTAACLAIGRKSEEFYRAFDVPPSRIFLTPYSVDNEFFEKEGDCCRPRREEMRRELDFPAGLPTLLYSGKFIPRKRPMDVIEAASRVATPIGLLLVGDGPLRPALEAEARRRGLNYVRFVGFQNQCALPRYYTAADIFVFPSAFEPYGLVLNEMMCMGLPILTTPAVAAAADLVQEGENGFLFPVGDVGALAKCIERLASDEELRRAMGRRSRQMIKKWTYEACVEGILNALETTVRPETASAK